MRLMVVVSALVLFFASSAEAQLSNWNFWRCIFGNRNAKQNTAAPGEPNYRTKVPARDRELADLALTMGFDYDAGTVQRISDEIEYYFRTANLAKLADELNGRNMLTGATRGHSQEVVDLMRSDKSPEEKRAALVALYRKKIQSGDTDILQVIRGLHGLEEDIGWERLWVGYQQYVLNQVGDIAKFSTGSESVDDLLFFPGAKPGTLVVYGTTYDQDPLALISTASEGTPVQVSQLKILRQGTRDKSTVSATKFSAEISLPDPSGKVPEGAQIVQAKARPQKNGDTYLVEPFKVEKETIALSRTPGGNYVFHFETGYRYRSRVDLDATPNGHDLEAVLKTALRDAGISNHSRSRWFDDGRLEIAFGPEVTPEMRARFEREMERRVRELSDPVRARESRQNPVASGVDVKEAKKAENSGYQDKVQVSQALGMSDRETSGHSTYFDANAIWHARYPILLEQKGFFSLSVDDRIYGEVHFQGQDAVQNARQNPMTPVRASGGGYIVYYHAEPAPLWTGYTEQYAIFSDEAHALAYIKTHRFTQGERRLR